jgi:hypothetical protein
VLISSSIKGVANLPLCPLLYFTTSSQPSAGHTYETHLQPRFVALIKLESQPMVDLGRIEAYSPAVSTFREHLGLQLQPDLRTHLRL